MKEMKLELEELEMEMELGGDESSRLAESFEADAVDKHVRMEVAKGRKQVEELEQHLRMLRPASFVVLVVNSSSASDQSSSNSNSSSSSAIINSSSSSSAQLRAGLVERMAQIVSTFTNAIARLHPPSPPAPAAAAPLPSPLSALPSPPVALPSPPAVLPSPLPSSALPLSLPLPTSTPMPTPATPSSATSGDSSPHSEPEQQQPQLARKKRKSCVLRSATATVKQEGKSDPPAAVPTADEDGHSWRKYGQKEILGSRYPRSYYRCTHKRDNGCPAIKYVQRSDKDPSLFHVTYKGHHTCRRRSPASGAATGTTGTAAGSPLWPWSTASSRLLGSSNSACLTMNRDGALQLGPRGPTLSPPAAPPVVAPPVAPSPASPASPKVDHLFDIDSILNNGPVFNIDDACLFDAGLLLY